ncbi:uncharacterized protein L3040_004616 [Drepanopeziza brunnea f. sp. 'multigermtubi']|uniref:uncharacterized protein n=1 Tax=Drepanopeziza brunnea f. sp. 'multigermtubi' TaxID=698441 RepID=UPI00238F6872|nr:hypothetical protein L3040_004616 [Drepanopeziza brunnea f. sp. 'multigermtubi']
MADIARKDVEILVHATAPSRGQDDTRYRALAQAYLDFQPWQRVTIVEELADDATLEKDTQAGSHLQHELPRSTQEDRESQKSFRPGDEYSSAEEDIYEYDIFRCSQPINSPDLSFNSVEDNAGSPVFQARVSCHVDAPEDDQNQEHGETGSWRAPPSEIADSQPENIQAMSIFSSPTRMLELYLQNQESQGSRTTSDLNSPEKLRQSSSLDLPAHMRGVPSLSPESSRNKSSSLEVPAGVRGRASLSPVVSRNTSSLELPARKGGESHSSPKTSDKTTSSLELPGPVRREASPLPETDCNKTSSLDLPSGLRGELDSSSGNAPSQSSPSPVKCPVRRSVRLAPPSTQDPALDLKRKWANANSDDSQSSTAPPTSAGRTAQPSKSTQHLLARPEKRLRMESPGAHVSVSRQPALPSSKPNQPSVTSSSSGPLVWNEKLEIRPRPPATSTGDLTAEMLLTPALANLEKKMPPLPNPAFQRRTLRDFERGYWLVNCEDWSEGRRNRCWEELGDFIGNDRAGWGVGLVREADFTSFRIYSFGYVAGHIYLLLYMASRSKIGKAGICWKGGDGETIIQMPS